ncbi:hypothetical protein RJ640_027155 [Escallonia rubra]|uniref:Glyoxylate/hydroxypyruvate reductase HPR3-like n=1 Tax=Escallonia rubra TaxID=112253 RepID=A0AA88S164_9ASTE|nr:hypothetical protein RJ640_027155 [Escallonia rubra]
MAEQQQHNHLPKLLVLGLSPVFRFHEQKFAQRFEILKAWETPIFTEEFQASHAPHVQAMLCWGGTPVAAEQLSHLPAIRLVVTSSTGVNHIDLRECRRRGIAVANSGNVYAQDVADTAVGLLIDVLRRISAADRLSITYSLAGKRVGIIGLGNIGQEVAKRLEAFGCIISYNSRKKKPSFPFPFYLDVCDLAANCDILVICCALTDQTHHMINKEVLLALGKEGVVVNIARGAIIDEKAFVQCLVQGDIAGAGLDVFECEPNVPKDLLELDNVVLSPHRAVFTEESFLDCFEHISGNLEAFFSNKPLLSPVIED